MSIMTHTGGGSSIVLRVGKGRYMFITGMISGPRWCGGGGGGMEYLPKKVVWGTTPCKTSFRCKMVSLVQKRLF